MQKKQSSKVVKVTSLEERLRIAREVNAYRKAHPKMRLTEVLQAIGKVSESNYYAWNKRLELAEAARKANGEEHADVQSFPLSIIPEKPKRLVAAKPARVHDQDKALAASLLEVAAALLKR